MWRTIGRLLTPSLTALLMQPAHLMAAEPGAVDGKNVFVALSVDKQGLRWDGLVIGMTLQQLEQATGAAIHLKEGQANLCGGVSIRRPRHGRELDLDLTGASGAEMLAGIFIPFLEPGRSLSAQTLVSSLKHQIAGLDYMPSRHQPALKEQDNPAPMFHLKGKPELVIFIKPGEGFYLGLADCLG